jgi:ABC-type transport system involved in Fe-S cluster assembly fused permease/ATPase subunit
MSRLFSFLEMSLLSFSHLLNLSFAWHTQRNTGEVLKILDRGAAINNAFQVRASLFLYLGLALTFPDSSCFSTLSRHLPIS